MNDMDDMLPGEFGAATRLSPKALRLYAEQGLLVPAGVDPATGYRRYHRDQIPRGRLIARLRTLNLPLARIAPLLALSTEAQERIRARLRSAGLSGAGPTLVHFHGFVTHDSDGPVEVAVPFTGSVEPVDDLRIRLSPAGTDAYLPVAEADAGFPDILGVYETLEAWIDANRLACLASPVEIRPGTGGALLDVTYPVAATGPVATTSGS